MLKRVLFTIIFILAGAFAASQPPADYYSSCAGLTGKALQQALHDIIDDHTVLTYSDLWTCYSTTDLKTDGETIWDMYSDIPGGTPFYSYTYGTDQCGNYSGEGSCYNREHSFPKSWFDDASPMVTDLFHIYPTDGYVNGKRSNYPFGEVGTAEWTSTNGSKLGPCTWPGYSGTVFEPIDEYKGDFARTYFYMATRYYGEDSAWPGSDMTEGSQPKAWALEMLLAWHRNDPVSSKETSRNNEVFEYQNNRNPFIDDPQFVEKIWGTLNATDIVYDYQSAEIYPNPASDIVNLRLPYHNCEDSDISIFDNTGCLVMKETVTDDITRIEVSGLIPGIYYVRVDCGTKVTRGVFVMAGK